MLGSKTSRFLGALLLTIMPLAAQTLGEITGTVTDPKGDSWYITLVNPKDVSATKLGVKTGEAANFFTLQIDPVTGSTRSYRPNVGG